MVFGRVTEGTSLLKKLDAIGTRSGTPKQRCVIADCGELSSRRQILAKLQVSPVWIEHPFCMLPKLPMRLLLLLPGGSV